jgi:hypothetical protein
MLLTDQLDFNNPDHVTVCCKHDRLTIYISNNNSSVRLTYALQAEDSCSPPPPPLQQSLPRSWVVENLGGIKS